jgi:hypothetical protein
MRAPNALKDISPNTNAFILHVVQTASDDIVTEYRRPCDLYPKNLRFNEKILPLGAMLSQFMLSSIQVVV